MCCLPACQHIQSINWQTDKVFHSFFRFVYHLLLCLCLWFLQPDITYARAMKIFSNTFQCSDFVSIVSVFLSFFFCSSLLAANATLRLPQIKIINNRMCLQPWNWNSIGHNERIDIYSFWNANCIKKWFYSWKETIRANNYLLLLIHDCEWVVVVVVPPLQIF